uniref:Uncharacterized protein n=1 Tax=Oryza punctata TaxID=4537 RepID=A0A0E0JNU9_ORYPU
MSGRVSDPGSAWFGGGERSTSAGPGRNVRLIATAVAAFVSVLGLALFLHLYVCHVRRRNRRRAAEAAALATANAGAPAKVGLDPSAIAALPTAAYGKPPPPPPSSTAAARCVHEKQDAEKEEAAAGSSAPVRVLGASLMKMLSRERPSARRQPGVYAVEMDDLESQLPRPQQQSNEPVSTH